MGAGHDEHAALRAGMRKLQHSQKQSLSGQTDLFALPCLTPEKVGQDIALNMIARVERGECAEEHLLPGHLWIVQRTLAGFAPEEIKRLCELAAPRRENPKAGALCPGDGYRVEHPGRHLGRIRTP
jgi:hypothetical protein